MEEQFKGVKKRFARKIPVEFFMTLAKVFNPNSYEELSRKTMKNVWLYFVNLMAFSFVLMLLFAIPGAIYLRDNIDKELRKFDELSVDINVTQKAPIYIKPLHLRIDTNAESEIGAERVLIAEDDLVVKRCMQPFCALGVKSPWMLNWDEYSDLTAKRTEVAAILIGIVLLLLPSILLTLFVGLGLYYLFLALVFMVFGFVLLRIVRKRMKLPQIFKLSLFALTPVVIVKTINVPFGCDLYYIPGLISLFYFVVGLILAAEKGFR
ncbi:DUF1189 domain-containing protein [Candidatus Woesearchaeota archaeon]|nr:DUF1189 domain-containing protein [Candidatus Woesearchaeota archaeon]